MKGSLCSANRSEQGLNHKYSSFNNFVALSLGLRLADCFLGLLSTDLSGWLNLKKLSLWVGFLSNDLVWGRGA